MLAPEVLAARRRPRLLPFVVLTGIIVALAGGAAHHQRAAVAAAGNGAHRLYLAWRSTGDGSCARIDDLVARAGTDLARDPWGRPYEFVCSKDIGDESIRSAGPDGILGTRDDVGYPR